MTGKSMNAIPLVFNKLSLEAGRLVAISRDIESSAQKDVLEIFHMNIRFSPASTRIVVRHQQVILYDEDFFVADPADQRSMRQKREATRRILDALYLNRR